jgi:hypothetical protein
MMREEQAQLNVRWIVPSKDRWFRHQLLSQGVLGAAVSDDDAPK